MRQALLLVIVYICIEHYYEKKRLSDELEIKSSELALKTLALEKKNLSMMESDLYRQLSDRVHSLETERDRLHQQLLEEKETNGDLKRERMETEWKIRDLSNNLEREKKTVQIIQRELSNSQRQVDQLRGENDRAKRRIHELEYERDHDPRNGCKCLCSRFDTARFCTSEVYGLVTHFVRRIPGSSIVLGVLDHIFEWIEPEVHRIGRQPSYLLS